MRQYIFILYFLAWVGALNAIHAQNITDEAINNRRCTLNGLSNPGFENFSSCPNSFSQFNKVATWFNPLASSQSTPDYFNNKCGFIGFNSNETAVTASPNNAFQGCGRAGFFLNYFSLPQDPKYREYIAQAVNIEANILYTLTLDVQRSSHTSSTTIQRDLVIYGYSGAIPAPITAYCINGAVELGRIDKNSLTTGNVNYAVNFTPTNNFDYLIIGAACDVNQDATANGYVFIDNIVLTGSGNNATTPIIKDFSGADDNACCFSGVKQDLLLSGNTPPSGVTVLWEQALSNPEGVVFTTPNQPNTGITGTGQLVNGNYKFYYSFLFNGCGISDTIIIEVDQLNLVADVADLPLNCFSIINNKIDQLSAIQPTIETINSNNLSTWWSMIKENGSLHVFPSGGCYAIDNGPTVTFLNGDPRLSLVNEVGTCAANGQVINANDANGTLPKIEFILPYDSVTFIWNTLYDGCGFAESSDTLLMVHRHITATTDCVIHDFENDSATGQIRLDVLDNSHLLPSIPGVSLQWSYTGGTLIPPRIINPNAEDSIDIVFYESGEYVFKVEANDGSCTWSDEVIINILDIKAEARDTLQCDIFSASNFQRLNAIAPSLEEINTCSIITWWSMLNPDNSEHVFPNGGCIPDDGRTVYTDSGSVRFFMSGSGRCPLLDENVISSSSNGTQPQLVFNYPIDSIILIWHAQSDLSDPSTLQMDTITVVHRHVQVASVTEALCVGDTAELYLSTNPTNNSALLPNMPGVQVAWSFTSGPVVPEILNPHDEDSIRVVFTEVGEYLFNVFVNDGHCTWNTFVGVSLAPLPNVSAQDVSTCTQLDSNYTATMNAIPSYGEINSNGLQSWWSVVLDDGSEHVFPNGGCVPDDGIQATGFDDNLVITASNACVSCAYLAPGFTLCDENSSNAPEAQFNFNKFANETFIWHVVYCGQLLTDTVQVSFGYEEPFADAGSDDTVSCQFYEFQGNISVSSAGNSGCSIWTQVDGPQSVPILNSLSATSFADFTNKPPGAYTFSYGLGCGNCILYDTVTIVVNNNMDTASITLSADVSNPVPVGEVITFTAAGAEQYAFLVDNVIVQDFSVVNTFSYIMPNDTLEVNVIGRDINGCIISGEVVVLYPEIQDEICNNGIDDDLDGLIDELDDDCYLCNARSEVEDGCVNSLLSFDASASNASIDAIIQNYQWSFGDGTTGSGILVEHQYASGGDYQIQLIIEDSMGCIDTVLSNIRIDDTIIIDLGTDRSICPGDSLMMAVSFEGVEPIWQDGSTEEVYYITLPGLYFVTVANNCGEFRDSIWVASPALPEVDLGDDQSICEGDSLLLLVTPNGGSTTWNDGSTDSVFWVTQAGSYTVSVTNECDTYNDSITITHPIMAEIDLGEDTVICPGGTVQLSVPSDQGSILWQDGSSGAQFMANNEGLYWVVVDNECEMVSDSILITFIENCGCSYAIPSAFTPNNDQVNDGFMMFTNNIIEANITIANRWGNIVFESNDVDFNWDGSYNGQALASDVFVYHIVMKCAETNEWLTAKGNVWLIR
ncbi:MAG: PKD domain-containing protein [Chitinophagales bacterium]